MNAIAFYQKKGVNFDVSEGSKSVLSKLNAVSSILSAVPGLAGTVSAFQNVISIKDSVLSLRTNASEKIDSVVGFIDKAQSALTTGQELLNAQQILSNTAKLTTATALQADALIGNEAIAETGTYVYPTVGSATAMLENEGIVDASTAAQKGIVSTVTNTLEKSKENLVKLKGQLAIVDGYIVKIENSLTDFGNVILFKLRNCVVSLDTKGPGSMEAFIPNAANNAANDEIVKITKNITTLQNNSIKSVNSILKTVASTLNLPLK